MGLLVHRAVRTDLLADELARVLRDAPADPFTPDLVAVPTKGVERFLAQRLTLVLGASAEGDDPAGGGDGVCANVSFPSPDDVVAAALAPGSWATDPWRPEELRWVVITQLSACLHESWAAPLRRFLVDAGTPDGDPWRGNGRLLALADRLAALFWSYDRERPRLVRAWAAGRDDDGRGGSVPADLAWQPHLWRLVREAVALPGPAERLPRLDDAATRASLQLPHRLSVFGPTRLPLLHLQVLQALAADRDVHLWLADPSPARWARSLPDHSPAVVSLRQAQDGATSSTAGPASATEPGAGPVAATAHPLLASLGRDSAELAARLQSPGIARDVLPPPPRPATLLGWLQDDITLDQLPADPSSRVLDPADRSVQIHACHGRQRQVEVLREVVLGLLHADETLQPRDILVMCPDLESFAPLVTATFAVGATRLPSPAHDLRVRVADRTPEQHNPVLTALDTLLRMVTGRITATEVLGFAALPPVADKFRLDTDDLDRLEDLVWSAGARWGLDAADRARFAVDTDQNTWQHGIERLLAGVVMSEDGLPELGGVLPLDDVGDSDVAAVGRLAELVDRLAVWAPRLREPQPAAAWLATVSGALTDLAAAPVREQWQLSAALGALNRLLGAAADCSAVLELGDVRVLLAQLLAGRPTRTNFRTGGVTVCSLVPMRSVPHRVVCLLGVDDGVFPRPHVVDGNDLVGRHRGPGERDRTSEDRQVLLDAVMAATETIVIVHTGADEHTNEPLPAAVPVAELLETLDATAVLAAGQPVREHVVVRHPLQPFDTRNFTADALVPGVFSHDVTAFDGARASLAVREPAPPLVTQTLPEDPPREVQLDDLSAFLRDPPGFFLRERLGLRFRQDEEAAGEELPLDLHGLDRWQVGTRLVSGLRDGLAGSAAGDDGGGGVDALLHAEQASGTLPPGRLGHTAAAGLREDAITVLDRSRHYLRGPRHDEQVTVDLHNGVRVVGTVSDVYGCGVTSVQFGAVRDKQVIDLWLRVLALGASRGDARCGGVVVGQEHRGGPHRERHGVKVLLGGTDPVPLLEQVVDLMLRGRQDPLPLTPRSSALYAFERRRTVEDEVLGIVRKRLWGTYSEGECDAREPSIAGLWGGDDPFLAFTSTAPLPDEQGWHPDESTRFGLLSRRLWDPVMARWEWLR